jgi:UDP-N-acetyl-D-mannosaminuronic acid dehydrogenase
MTYDVCVVGGCGRVGLPLALCLAKEGKRVIVFDINEQAVVNVRSGKMPFHEDGAEDLLREALDSGRLELSSAPESVAQSATVVLILGTPIDAHFNPSFSAISRAVKQCMPHFRDGQLIVLRSTVYPGTTEKIAGMLADSGLSVDVVFCPERVMEGRSIKETYTLPQLISGFTPQGYQRARELFSIFGNQIIELLPFEAELAKIFCNVWRYVGFAVANQFYTIANDHGVDYYRIREAMMRDYPRAKDLPKAGFAAGPCLLKDTVQLSTLCNNNFFLGHAAMLVNEGLPAYIVNTLKGQMSLHDKVVGILGMAFKGNSDDARWSLAYKLRKILELECKEVLITDPQVVDERILPLEDVIERSDMLILGAPHSIYKDLQTGGRPIIDVWDFLGGGGIIRAEH